MSARRTKKVAPLTFHELCIHIEKVAATPEGDALVANLEAVGLTNWAAVLRRVFADGARGRRITAGEERYIDRQGVGLDPRAAAQHFVNQLGVALGYPAPPVVTTLTAEQRAQQPHLVASANEKEIRLLG